MKNKLPFTYKHKVEIEKSDNKQSYYVFCETLNINTNVCQTEINSFLDRYYNMGLKLEIITNEKY